MRSLGASLDWSFRNMEVWDEGGLKGVEGDLGRRDAEGVEHIGACFDHHGRAAKVEFDGFGIWVLFEEFDEDDFVDEAGVALPMVIGQGVGEGDMEIEVRVTGGEVVKEIVVKDFLAGACSVPEGDFAFGVLGFEEVGDVGAERGHAGAAADVEHFLLGRFDMEIAEGADGGDGIAGFEVEDIGGADAWGAVHALWGCRDADIKGEGAFFGAVAGEGVIIAAIGVVVGGDQIEKVIALPDIVEGCGDIEIAEADLLESGDVELEVIAWGEGDVLVGVDGFEHQFFDKSGDAAITDDL